MSHTLRAGTRIVIVAIGAFLFLAPRCAPAIEDKYRFEGQCEPFNRASFDQLPAFSDSVPAEYIDIAFKARLGGAVALVAAIEADGSICDVIVLESPHPLLERSAIAAIRASAFKPASLDSAPVRGVIEVVYTFDLEREQRRRDAIDRSEILVKTETELRRLLNEGDTNVPHRIARGLSHLGVANTKLLIELLSHPDYGVRSNAAYGLGRIGSSEAVAGLIDQVSRFDGTRKPEFCLVDALELAGVVEAVPALRELERKLRPDNRIYADGVLHSIERIENRDLLRPLVVLDGESIRFRFLLDEVCRIYYLMDSKSHASDSRIYTVSSSDPGRRANVEHDAFRLVCDMLSDGEARVVQGGVGRGAFVVIELCGGDHVALRRDGNEFWLHQTGWNGRSEIVSIRSGELAAFCDRVMDGE